MRGTFVRCGRDGESGSSASIEGRLAQDGWTDGGGACARLEAGREYVCRTAGGFGGVRRRVGLFCM